MTDRQLHPLLSQSGSSHQAATSHRHCSVIAAPQSGQGTSQPQVAVTGSSASTSQQGQFHQPVVIVVSIGTDGK